MSFLLAYILDDAGLLIQVIKNYKNLPVLETNFVPKCQYPSVWSPFLSPCLSKQQIRSIFFFHLLYLTVLELDSNKDEFGTYIIVYVRVQILSFSVLLCAAEFYFESY